MEKNKTAQSYKDYLNSAKWLIKKSELVAFWIKRGWKIRCVICDSTQNLQVHHETYDTLFNEELMDLMFLCSSCHKKWHFEKGFKENWLNDGLSEIIDSVYHK